MNEFNENNQYEPVEESKLEKENTIPAIAVPVNKHKKGKGIAMTLALVVASFGAGSLYTSYSWIQDEKQQIESDSVQSTPPTPSNISVNETSASKNTGDLSISEVNKKVADSVVEISTESVANDMFMRQYVKEGAGSGVVISKDGYIVTNNHVVGGAAKIVVRLKNGKEYTAKLVGTDPQTDIAVIKIQGVTLTPATIGDSSKLVVGETVVAIGNPLGQLGGTITNGIISALDRQIVIDNQTMTLLQTNAAINPGNSGGGLFNDRGELIGLVVAKSAATNVEGLGFAIPSNIVKDVMQSIIDVGYVQGRPVLGVSIVNIDSPEAAYQNNLSRMGVYIAGFTKGTEAEKSGLKVKDCIVAVNDQEINTTTDLLKLLQKQKVGDKVKVTVVREGKMLAVDVKLSESKPVDPETESKKQDNTNVPQETTPRTEQDILNDIFGGLN